MSAPTSIPARANLYSHRHLRRRIWVTAGVVVVAVVCVIVLLINDGGQAARAHGDVPQAPRLTAAVDAGQPITDSLPPALRGGLQGMVARTALPAGHVLVSTDWTDLDSPHGASIALDLASRQFPATLVYGQTVVITGLRDPASRVRGFVERIHPTTSGALITVVIAALDNVTDVLASADALRLVGLR